MLSPSRDLLSGALSLSKKIIRSSNPAFKPPDLATHLQAGCASIADWAAARAFRLHAKYRRLEKHTVHFGGARGNIGIAPTSHHFGGYSPSSIRSQEAR